MTTKFYALGLVLLVLIVSTPGCVHHRPRPRPDRPVHTDPAREEIATQWRPGYVDAEILEEMKKYALSH